jgi:hypothetical protein
VAEAGEMLAALVPEFEQRLTMSPDRLRTRPDSTTWSALEYACHVRDCLALYHWRISTVLAEDRPEMPPMRRDAVVLERAYNDQEPAAVGAEITANYMRLAHLLGRLAPADWQRAGVREGVDLSVAWMAVNTVHELRHHLKDIDEVLVKTAPRLP